MKEKGVLFTVMIFIIALALIDLINFANQQKNSSEGIAAEISGVKAVNNKFENLYSDIIDYYRTGSAKAFRQSLIPFSYELDENSFKAVIDLPARKGTRDGFFDVINTFKVFAEDQNYSRNYDGIKIQAETVRNAAWGSQDTNELAFMLGPACLSFKVIDLNQAGFEGSPINNSCSTQFNVNSLQRIDLNIIIKEPIEDYNRIECHFPDFNGGTGCPQEAFDSLNPNPYIKIDFNSSACIQKCSGDLNQAIVSISHHFDPSQDFNVEMKCLAGASQCNSIEPVTINWFSINAYDKGITAEHRGNKQVRIEMKATLKQAINSFEFKDFNFTATTSTFSIIQTNKK
ncbi:MAG: hypothetical protein AB1467_04560 [Candidatus Diapherotrites archaeon]